MTTAPAAAHDPADDRIHLVVLYGGQSAEHDVSCVTAAHVMRAADPSRYRITPVGIGRDGTWALGPAPDLAVTDGTMPPLDPRGQAISPVDVVTSGQGRTVVVPLLHGPMGEDGTVQGLLELTGVPYVGTPVLGSAVAMDKAMAKQVMTANGIVLRTRVDGIRVAGRITRGVRVVNLMEGDNVVAVAVLTHADLNRGVDVGGETGVDVAVDGEAGTGMPPEEVEAMLEESDVAEDMPAPEDSAA